MFHTQWSNIIWYTRNHCMFVYLKFIANETREFYPEKQQNLERQRERESNKTRIQQYSIPLNWWFNIFFQRIFSNAKQQNCVVFFFVAELEWRACTKRYNLQCFSERFYGLRFMSSVHLLVYNILWPTTISSYKKELLKCITD